jgi:hypothetical protein
MEPTVPSTKEHKGFLSQHIIVKYDNLQVKIDLYDNPLCTRFLDALKDNLVKKRILEKNFCFIGWAGSKRNLDYLVMELNKNIEQINSFDFKPKYEKIKTFASGDFQYSSDLPIGKWDNGDISKTLGKRLKHESCNLLHRHFERLQGNAWELSPYYKQADHDTKYAIRQLNNICHEIEGWVNADRKMSYEPEWTRPSQIMTFLNAPRIDLHEMDYELFKHNRYDRHLGGVYLHWSQVGKTLYEVFRDEDAPKMTDAMCSEINHQKYYSGEFDIEWGATVTEAQHEFKKQEMDQYRDWLRKNNYNWEDPKLSLGYIKLGQIDMGLAFGNKTFLEVYDEMKNNLNVTGIQIVGSKIWQNDYDYSLDDDRWRQIQIEHLKEGYESRSVR